MVNNERQRQKYAIFSARATKRRGGGVNQKVKIQFFTKEKNGRKNPFFVCLPLKYPPSIEPNLPVGRTQLTPFLPVGRTQLTSYLPVERTVVCTSTSWTQHLRSEPTKQHLFWGYIHPFWTHVNNFLSIGWCLGPE